MDMIFVWLIAAATLGLLGIFLIASERELKQKRQEVEELKNKLTETPPTHQPDFVHRESTNEDSLSAELAARNEELLQTISELSKRLEASDSNAEQLETLRRHLNSAESENSELQASSERLHAKVSELKAQSELNDFRPGGGGTDPEAAEQIAQMREQLEANRVTIWDLEKSRDQLAEAEARCTNLQEFQSRLEAANRELETELATEREKENQLLATQSQVAEIEQQCQELIDANLRLQHENSELRQHCDQYQENETRWASLRERVEQLRLKQAEISEKDRGVEEEILAMSRLLQDGLPHLTSERSTETANYASFPENGIDKANGTSTTDDLSESKKKRRFGIFPTN
jgi:regulator of replication initiation timing